MNRGEDGIDSEIRWPLISAISALRVRVTIRVERWVKDPELIVRWPARLRIWRQ